MSEEICRFCEKLSTPWVSINDSHACESCTHKMMDLNFTFEKYSIDEKFVNAIFEYIYLKSIMIKLFPINDTLQPQDHQHSPEQSVS